MKVNFLIILILLLSFFSCTTRFENNTRILVKGRVIDDNGNPISNAQISVYTQRSNGVWSLPSPSGNDEYVLGRNYSDSNGDFSVTSLFDTDADFSIEINAGSDYARYGYYTSTTNYMPSDLVFDLENVELKRIGDFNYNISRISGEGNSINFTFRYENTYCNQFFLEEELIEEQSYCFENDFYSRTLNDNNPDIESSFYSTIGSTVEFVYSINDQPEIIETFIINEPTYEFTFTY